MNETKQKIVKTSKVVAIVLKISLILVAIAIGALLLGIGFLALGRNGLSESLQQTLTIAAGGASAMGIAISNLIWVCSLGIVVLIATFMVLFTLHRLFVNISNEPSPFTKNNVKVMKRVAVWTVIMCVVECIVSGISDKLLTGEITFTVDFIWLVVAAAVYGIALIFDYGTQLQQQSDETL